MFSNGSNGKIEHFIDKLDIPLVGGSTAMRRALRKDKQLGMKVRQV